MTPSLLRLARPARALCSTLLTAAVAVAAFLMATPVLAQTPAKLQMAGSEIAFTSKQLGVPVEGRFKQFDAQVVLDPKQPAKGQVSLKVDLASATLGVPETDAELRKGAWFDTSRFPQAVFQSTALKASGPGRYEMSGKLTLKGTARDLVVPVTLTQAGGTTTATGQFTLKRLAFRIGEGEWADTGMVADDVQVRFKFLLTGLGPI